MATLSMTAWASLVSVPTFICFAILFCRQNRQIRRVDQILTREIATSFDERRDDERRASSLRRIDIRSSMRRLTNRLRAVNNGLVSEIGRLHGQNQVKINFCAKYF